MSGGAFGYLDMRLKEEIFGWTDDFSYAKNAFEDMEISALVWDVLDLIHEYDWYVSGDNGENTYLKAKAASKKKWFDDKDKRLRMMLQMVNSSLDKCKAELQSTYDFAKEGK